MADLEDGQISSLKPRLTSTTTKQNYTTTVEMGGSPPLEGFIVESLASTLLGLTESLPHIRYRVPWKSTT